MTRLNQVTYHEYEAGNCLATCMACILEIDPQDLPRPPRAAIHEDAVWEHYSENLIAVLWQEHDHRLYCIEPREGPPRGLAIASYWVQRPAEGVEGACHSVVVENGILIWDPNPIRRMAGETYAIENLQDWLVLERKEELE